MTTGVRRGYSRSFQYPLFRIVDCFNAGGAVTMDELAWFQYPLFRIVDCFR